MNKNSSLLKFFMVPLFSILSNTLHAEPATLTGSAIYRERIALPPNAVFEATLEDVSLMDVPAVILGRVSIDHAVKNPINFTIQYNAEDIKPRRRYNVRGKITVDGKLKFITDTIHPVFTDKDTGGLELKMIMVKTAIK